MSKERAYSVLTVKAVSEDKRTISGTATTPNADRVGDVVQPLGIKFTNPMPLLWQHRHEKPVGSVKFAKPTKNGIDFVATFPVIDTPGEVQDRVENAWTEVKAGLIRAVSIGFMPTKYNYMDDGGIEFVECEVYELSLVTIPANADATIQSIKSIDRALRTATGQKQIHVARLSAPGVTGKKAVPVKPQTQEASIIMAKKTYTEQIAEFTAKHLANAKRMEEIMGKASDDGLTLDDAQTEEFDGLESDNVAIDKHLVRLRALEKNAVSSAVEVNGTSTELAVQTRGAVRVQVIGSNMPKGIAFTRYTMALAKAKGNVMQAAEMAKAWHDSTPEVEAVLKAAAAAGTTTDAAWAKPLVEYQNMAAEFIELLRPRTIIGRIPGLRRVPFNIKIPRQTAGSTAQWVGEGVPKPVGTLAFDQITLGHTKLAGIVVLTEELVRFSNPSAEALVQQDLSDTIVALMDRDFVDPAKAAVSDVSPASITYGVTPVTASGTTSDAVRSDVKKLMAKFLAANLSLAGAVWIMSEQMALTLAMMQTALGQPEFPGLSIAGDGTGGTFFSIPVVVSENVPGNAGSGSPLTGVGARIILARAGDILLADDGEILLDVSREASLQMDTAPTNPPVAATVMVSLWQQNMVGIRAERYINWAKRRAGSVQFIDSAAYIT